MHEAGETGAGKTALAALAQQHYGAGFSDRNLPGSWSSTANATEALAFTAKDMLLVIDDFCPNGTRGDIARYNKEADRIFRAQGNSSGRLRMRADSTLRNAKPPRGLILSTGEDIPRGRSLRARVFVLELSPNVNATAFEELIAGSVSTAANVDPDFATNVKEFCSCPFHTRMK
jgi:Domain of unknown function (DUF927)